MIQTNELKVLLVVPEIRLDSGPQYFPFWAGILAAIAQQKNADVGILDLNALRMKFDGKKVPIKYMGIRRILTIIVTQKFFPLLHTSSDNLIFRLPKRDV